MEMSLQRCLSCHQMRPTFGAKGSCESHCSCLQDMFHHHHHHYIFAEL